MSQTAVRVPLRRFCFFGLPKKAYLCGLNCYYYHYGYCHRFIDSFVGHHARCGLRLFHEERHVADASSGEQSNLSTIGFAIGFVLMMVLDVVMG